MGSDPEWRLKPAGSCLIAEGLKAAPPYQPEKGWYQERSCPFQQENTSEVDQRFPKSCRLLDSIAYERVFKNPDFRVSNKYFLILGCWTLNGSARLGVIVAKKNIALAAQRNRIKRQIREAFRTRREELEIKDFNADIVVMMRKGPHILENKECRTKFHELLVEIVKKKHSI